MADGSARITAAAMDADREQQMRPKTWHFEGEPIEDFDQAVETVRQVIGEPVLLRISEPDSKPAVEVFGVLAEGRASEAARAVFHVGESAYLTLVRSSFVSGRRSSVDGGDYWGISVQQGGLTIRLTEDYHASG